MIDPDRIERLVQEKARAAGRRYERVRQAYRDGQESALTADVRRDEEGRARIVCRRYAERRAVPLDERGRPSCYDGDHQDCQGCLEDLREGAIET